MLADMYEADKEAIDKNGDGKIQYIVFKGEPGNPEAEARTEYAVKQAEERGLVMDNMGIEPLVANWMTDQAQTQMEAQMSANGDKIEAVFCNNDDMALGAIAGINGKSDAPVFGVDATEAGMEAIKSGKMAGTVKQDGDAMGKALVAIGANAAQGKDFIEGTDYEMAEDGFSVRIPYAPITK